METKTKTINGFNAEAIEKTVAAIVENPKIAAFELRATNTWISGVTTAVLFRAFMADARKIRPGKLLLYTTTTNHPFCWVKTKVPIRQRSYYTACWDV